MRRIPMILIMRSCATYHQRRGTRSGRERIEHLLFWGVGQITSELRLTDQRGTKAGRERLEHLLFWGSGLHAA
jgi:hypothetical protein